MFRVVDYFAAVRFEKCHGIRDDLEVLFFADAESTPRMKIPALAEDRNRGGLGVDQLNDVRIILHSIARESRGAESGQAGVSEVQFLLGAGEELLVLRVGTRPATFDVVDPQFIEPAGNRQLILDGKRYSFPLRPVTERRIES